MQHSEYLSCLASLRHLILSECMPPLGTFCFPRVSPHLLLPTQNWLLGQFNKLRESATVIKVNKGCFCYGEVSERNCPNASGHELRKSEVRSSENLWRTTPKRGKPKLLEFGNHCFCSVCQLHCLLNNHTGQLRSWSSWVLTSEISNMPFQSTRTDKNHHLFCAGKDMEDPSWPSQHTAKRWGKIKIFYSSYGRHLQGCLWRGGEGRGGEGKRDVQMKVSIIARLSRYTSCIRFPRVFMYSLRELGSYVLRDTPKPWQLKAPDPKPTIKQLKEARKGNGSSCKGNQWPRKGNGPPVIGTEALLIVKYAFWEKLNRGGSKPGGVPLFFQERSRLCRGPFWDCSS